MKAKLKRIDYQKTAIVEWDDDDKGHGRLIFQWDDRMSRYVVDTELLSIDTIIEIIKSIED